MRVTGGSIQQYLSEIYTKYRDSEAPAKARRQIIVDALAPIETLSDAATTLQNRILLLDGAWCYSEKVCKLLREARRCVEDMLCYALLGIEDLVVAHRDGLLTYQSL